MNNYVKAGIILFTWLVTVSISASILMLLGASALDACIGGFFGGILLTVAYFIIYDILRYD